MKHLFIYLLFIFSIVIVYGFVFSIGQTDSADDGKSIFIEQKCTSCHSISVQDIISKKKDATDLSLIGKSRDEAFLIQYLKKEVKLDDKLHKSIFKGSDDQLKILAKWLAALKQNKVKNLD